MGAVKQLLEEVAEELGLDIDDARVMVEAQRRLAQGLKTLTRQMAQVKR